MVNSSDPTDRSVGRTARLDLAEFFAVLDRRDLIMRQCESFLDDYDAWLMPVMPDAAFIRQKQSEPLVIDGTPQPYFFAGTAYNFLANLTGQPSIVLPCGFSKDGLPIGLQLTGKRWGDAQPARRRQGAGETSAALSGAAELQGLRFTRPSRRRLRGSASSGRARPSGRRRKRQASSPRPSARPGRAPPCACARQGRTRRRWPRRSACR